MPRKAWGTPGSKVTRKGRRRPVIVTVYPDGIIGLRLSKQRREEYVDAASTYRGAVVQRVANEKAAKKKARKAKG
jgi:hypothetical protein